MFDEELVEGLKDIIETKELSEIKNFLVFLWLAEGELEEKEIDGKYNIGDIGKYLDYIESFFIDRNFFDNKEKELKEKYKGVNLNEIYRPCIDIIYNVKAFYDLFAGKVEDADYSLNTSRELVESINILLKFTNIDRENFDNEEEYEEQKELLDLLTDNLKETLYTKISLLNLNDFLDLSFNEMDSYYDELIKERIDQMEEEDLYKYLLKIDYIPQVAREKVKILDSSAINNFYAEINGFNYSKKGNIVEYLMELKSKAIDNEGKDAEIYLEELSKLNNQEFLMYLVSEISSEDSQKCYNEEEIIERKIKELSDIDLETVYYMIEQDYEKNPELYNELNNRNLLVEKTDKEGYKYLEIKDNKIAEQRGQKYDEILEYDYCIAVIKPNTSKDYYIGYENILQKIEDNMIKTICELDRATDLECLKQINRLNKKEKTQDYESALNYEEIFFKDKPLSDKALIGLYSQRCKYEIIKYLNKRIISMPIGYFSMIDISNEDGIFNNMIEMRLDDKISNIEVKKSDGIER